MTNEVLFSKIESVRHSLARIQSKTPQSVDELLEDDDLQDILSVNLERAVQGCVDIAAHIIAYLEISVPETMAESFDALALARVITNVTAEHLKKSVGFRNISVHEYEKIDWTIVYKIVTEHLVDFKTFIKEVITWQERENELRVT